MEEKTIKPAAKRALVPKLRFPEFLDAGEWKEKQLHQVAKPVSDKASGKEKNNILTLSGEQGLVLQSEYFGKKIAGENVERYIRIVRNDFVYNDRTTKLSTYGSIKRLSNHESGVVSPIYKCFRFNDAENPAFWEWYFESGSHEGQLHGLINEGARAGRFNISIEKFLSTLAWHPESSEQQKIADCLTSLDELITAEAQKLDTLKTHKKGLMQQLFPAEGETLPKLRFPEFREQWSETQLDKLCSNISSGRDQIDPNGAFDLYGSTSVIGKTRNPSYSGERILVARVGANAGLLTKAKGVFGVTDNTLVVGLNPSTNIDFLFHYLGNININRLIFGSGQPLITGSILKTLPVLVPADTEQRKISACLSSLDEMIIAQGCKLETIKTHKKGLMQQLFPSSEEVEA